MLTLTSPVKTWAHGLPAAVKLTALCGATIGLFALNSPLPLAIAALAAVLLVLSGGAIFAKTALRHLRPLWPFVLIVALWHLWSRDLSGGAVVILRMLTAVTLANFVTMTTRLSDMIAVFQTLARPLQPLGDVGQTPPIQVAGDQPPLAAHGLGQGQGQAVLQGVHFANAALHVHAAGALDGGGKLVQRLEKTHAGGHAFGVGAHHAHKGFRA